MLLMGPEVIVQNHPTLPAAPALETASSETSSETSSPRPSWHAEVSRLLSHAAELCVAHGLDVESFMSGAWSAYVESRPGMREHLEELQLREQLDELRKLGRLGEA
ncbi:MAG: hypothetical protein H7138_16945 [Myxococcales bacterium]|nr:hypothetical protein [Myxococcales bacterium]